MEGVRGYSTLNRLMQTKLDAPNARKRRSMVFILPHKYEVRTSCIYNAALALKCKLHVVTPEAAMDT